MSIQRAYEWTAPNGETLHLLLHPTPRLQVEEDPGDWVDTIPAKWLCVLFAKLAELVGSVDEHDIPRNCFEITDVEVGDTGADMDEDVGEWDWLDEDSDDDDEDEEDDK